MFRLGHIYCKSISIIFRNIFYGKIWNFWFSVHKTVSAQKKSLGRWGGGIPHKDFFIFTMCECVSYSSVAPIQKFHIVKIKNCVRLSGGGLLHPFCFYGRKEVNWLRESLPVIQKFHMVKCKIANSKIDIKKTTRIFSTSFYYIKYIFDNILNIFFFVQDVPLLLFESFLQERLHLDSDQTPCLGGIYLWKSEWFNNQSIRFGSENDVWSSRIGWRL